MQGLTLTAITAIEKHIYPHYFMSKSVEHKMLVNEGHWVTMQFIACLKRMQRVITKPS